MVFTFYTSSCWTPDGTFGCASHGFDNVLPEENDKRVCGKDVDGLMLTGSYEEILAAVPDGKWQAGLALFGNAGGENEFIRTLSDRLSIPFSGGGAAIDGITGRAGLITGEGQAAVFLIDDGRYDVSVESRNIHTKILGECRVDFDDPRVIGSIDGQDPASFLAERRAEFGLAESDFEHVTLSDEKDINAHFSKGDGVIVSGRDLAPVMKLRYMAPETTLPEMEAFYADPDAVIFGCAGLKGTLPGPMRSGGLGLYMFGEVCTMEKGVDFGNLMLSKIIIKEKT